MSVSIGMVIALIKKLGGGGGGGGGTSNYNSLSNKPQINGTTLSGNKSLSDLGIISIDDTAGDGATNVTWSADKLTDMIGDIETLLAAI